MMFRFLVICGCLLAVGQAGVIGGGLLTATGPAAIAVHPAAALSLPTATAALAVPTLSASSSNVIRGIGNLAAISAYSKSVDTPFSSVRRADVRVNNPGIVTASAEAAPLVAVANTALAGPAALLAPGLTTAIAGAPAIATGLAAAPIGLNGLALNGIGALRVL